MKHLATTITSIEELDHFFEKNMIHFNLASSVLVQIFASRCDTDWIRHLTTAIRNFSPKWVIVGVTTDGGILDGRVITNETVISFSIFVSSLIMPVMQKIQPGTEIEAAESFLKKLEPVVSRTKGVLLFATTFSVDCSLLLQQIYNRFPGLPLFGGGAADYSSLNRTLVFSDDQMFDSGLAAIVFIGEELHLTRKTYLGWRPVGKTMTVTKTDGFIIREIDGKPAFEIYEKYLGIKHGDNFYTDAIEFPLLLKRGKHTLARVPVFSGDDGSISLVADIKEGEKLQLGYGQIDMILENANKLRSEIAEFAPQAIFFYSCAVRRAFMQEEVELELLPLQKTALSAGFFTAGEFCDLGDQSPLMNSTIVVAALREGEPEIKPVETIIPETANPDPYQRRHTHILSRFQHLVDTIANELTETNKDLKKQTDEIRKLRGILPICSACKKIRDDKGYWNQLEMYIQENSGIQFSHSLCPECYEKLYYDII